MRLLTILTIAELALGGAGLAASVLLVKATNNLQHLASQISSAVDSVYTAEQAERSLLVHNRESLLLGITGRTEHLRLRDRAQAELESALKTLRNYAEFRQEQEVLDQATSSAAQYLRERAQLESQGREPNAIVDSVLGAMDETRGYLDTLVQINYDQAQSLQRQAQSEHEFASVVGYTAAGAVVLVLAGAFLLLHRGLHRPLQSLKTQMASLEAGSLSPITPGGPSELQEVAVVFNHLVTRLRQQRESQLRFLAGIAHDLRTPLNAIRLSTQYLTLDQLDDDQRSTLEAVERQVAQLDRQVEDLLDTTRIEAGHLDLRMGEHDLAELAGSAAKVFGGMSQRHRVQVSAAPASVRCECDAIRIGQVLNNLLSNAIKYSPSGGEISVHVSAKDGKAEVKITDQGIGIAKEDLAAIFEPFRRTAATRESIPGVGLGLSVAKRIVEAHGGLLTVSSVKGAGSTFTVMLPLKGVEG